MPQGDPGGIGPETALAVLARPEVRERCRPLILGHRDLLASLARDLGIAVQVERAGDAEEAFARGPEDPLPVLELENELPGEAPAGQPHPAFGAAALEAVLRGGSLCLAGGAELLLTPPIHKQSLHLAGYPYEGQTRILGELCRSRRYGMLACSGRLRILVATRHMALKEALVRLDANLVAKQIRIAHEAAHEVLGIPEPRVVLAGLNPHAGEGGAFGDEERRILRPAIRNARDRWGYETAGPAVPDVVFKEGLEGRWDVVVALYHDQAFIPLKLLDRRQGYTLFVGGPILRVSPLHGAAYDRARTGSADPEPLAFALEKGLELARRRTSSRDAAGDAAQKVDR